MKLAAPTIALLFAAACGSDAVDTPEVAQRKTECKQLVAHILQVSPESRGELAGRPEAEQQKRLAELAAKVPIEDIQQCAAADPAVVACMKKAPDTAAVRACIPPPKKG